MVSPKRSSVDEEIAHRTGVRRRCRRENAVSQRHMKHKEKKWI